MIEQFTENGLQINRFHCKEGFIDYVVSPTNPKKYLPGGQHVCHSAPYYRLNNSEWFDSYNFKNNSFWFQINELSKEFTSGEIWSSFLK